MTEDARKPCPHCGESIIATALKCRFCGERFNGTPGVVGPPANYSQAAPQVPLAPAPSAPPFGVLAPPTARFTPPSVPVAVPGIGVPDLGAAQVVSAGTFIGLSVVTLGIYPIYRFYIAGELYERLSLRRSDFKSNFGIYIGAIVACFFLNLIVPVVGFVPLLIAGYRLLAEVMTLRDEAVRNFVGAPPASFQSKNTHIGMWVGGYLGSLIVIGLVPAIIQAIWFFGEYNEIVSRLSPGAAFAGSYPAPLPSSGSFAVGAGTAPAPPPSAPRATEGATFCSSCGKALAAGTRFCAGCGSPVSSG